MTTNLWGTKGRKPSTGCLTDMKKEERIRSWFRANVISDTNRWERFCKAVKTGDAETVQELFNTFLLESISIRDTAVRKEKRKTFGRHS